MTPIAAAVDRILTFMFRRMQTVYVRVDPFFSPRGKVLHRFDRFLQGLAQAKVPCIWLTGSTRAQLDEPRRRLAQKDPYVGENGSGVYLPEDYFHLRSGNALRLGRFSCIPVAKPQPAAAEALDELAADLRISVVPLRSLSPRELSQNTGLPPKEAERMRMRDFDELFFFAGASQEEVHSFRSEARLRGLRVGTAGSFWSLAPGADLDKCIRELGGLYDRALRAHALRVGVELADASGEAPEPQRHPAFDRTYELTERIERPPEPKDQEGSRGRFHLYSESVWDDLLSTILGGK
jgi:predicted mannosyl-3-phosphoglycerate phosphatase (HAD superfamily)